MNLEETTFPKWRCFWCGVPLPHHAGRCLANNFPAREEQAERDKQSSRRGPTRATTLPTDAKARKTYPVASGVLDYFPDAIAALSHLSHKGNEQHNPGEPLYWNRAKSTDEADTMMRHFLERGSIDKDGIRHTVKMAWRALAILQKEIECLPREAV